jgi:hypothetical protein
VPTPAWKSSEVLLWPMHFQPSNALNGNNRTWS